MVTSVLPLTRFQFHKGTIKPFSTTDNFDGKGRFQFHKGTIKPKWGGKEPKKLDNFNSIKVRLNLGYSVDGGPAKCDFNSIKVRLNQNVVYPRKGKRIIFQFHKGTIKPSFKIFCVAAPVISIP